MTPEMSARDLSFARKTTTTRGMLEKYWTWGERDQLDSDGSAGRRSTARASPSATRDRRGDDRAAPREARPRRPSGRRPLPAWRAGRAQGVLDDLQRLAAVSARTIGLQRDAVGRTAADGLPPGGHRSAHRPDHDRRQEPASRIGQSAPSATAIAWPSPGSTAPSSCATSADEANRANATFYPLDPRGLTAFDEPIMKLGTSGPPPPPLPPSVDRARLTARLESLRALAADTDGMAIVQTNDLERGFKRIVADLSSYYLLGYYSDRRMDGRFHSIRVRVKRPGVQVRARRGYLAPSAGGSRRGGRPRQESCHVSRSIPRISNRRLSRRRSRRSTRRCASGRCICRRSPDGGRAERRACGPSAK